jgi:4-diphosphocytidyl-2-C-methyl-D-erythritol kinase
MTHLSLPSPAKINLFLHVNGRREDGYHLLQTAYQFIDFYDDLSLHLRPDSDITLQTSSPAIPPAENLVMKAARRLQAYTHCKKGVHINLIKRIPMGSGLGGGSSNAATTLLALNQLWQTQLSLPELKELGLQLGADVPIFLHGRAAFAEGVGEQFYPIDPPEHWILLLFPACHSETKRIFSDPELTRDTPKFTIQEFLRNGGHNDCEPITRKHFPQVVQALDCLSQYTLARMTGTGSGVFAVFESREAACKIAEKIPAPLKRSVVQGLNNSPLLTRLENRLKAIGFSAKR